MKVWIKQKLYDENKPITFMFSVKFYHNVSIKH